MCVSQGMLFFYIFLVMNCLKYKSTIPQWFVRQNVVFTFYFNQQFCTVKDLKHPLKKSSTWIYTLCLAVKLQKVVLEYSPKMMQSTWLQLFNCIYAICDHSGEFVLTFYYLWKVPICSSAQNATKQINSQKNMLYIPSTCTY